MACWLIAGPRHPTIRRERAPRRPLGWAPRLARRRLRCLGPSLQGKSDEVGEPVDVELVHQTRLVDLDGAGADAQLRRDLPIVPSRHHLLHYLALARR
jgi:hypothetical protein